jgi:hypothetical protein
MTRRMARGAVAAAMAAAFGLGLWCGARRLFPYTPLRAAYHRLRQPFAPPPRTHAAPRWFPAAGRPAAEQREALAALPYVQGYGPPSVAAGVLVHDAAAAWDGLNLAASAHATEAVLTDMSGTVLHRWARRFDEVWPGRPVPGGEAAHDRFWRRVELLPGGELLAVFENLGVIKLDRESRLLWSWAGTVHHDVAPLADGGWLALVREPAAGSGGGPAFEDSVVELDPAGRPRRTVSLRRCFVDSGYAPLLDRLPPGGDRFHTNRVGVVPAGLDPPFTPGLVLVSLRTVGVVALVDLERERVVWALSGLWRGQHDPTPLPGPRLLILDNWWQEGRSRVLELDALTQQVRWQYPAAGQPSFFTAIGGAAQRLPNGNTLIVETTAGRAFEVDAGGRTVWDYRSPHRAGERGELVAALFQLTRLPRSAAGFLDQAARTPALGSSSPRPHSTNSSSRGR